jgi:AcrR family transcriptional regulator
MMTIINYMANEQQVNRLDRRKARTRAALVAAARQLLTHSDPAEVSIQEITDLADVGFGSFYNHFDSKQALFDVAVEEVMEEHGAMLDEITGVIADPAEVFAASVRITARFPRTHPELARIIDRTGPRYLTPALPRARCVTCNAPRTPAVSRSMSRRSRSPASVERSWV